MSDEGAIFYLTGTDTHSGGTTVDASASLTVTNTAPLDFSQDDLLSQVTIDGSYFDTGSAEMTDADSVLGGDVSGPSGGGCWTYTPTDNTWDTEAPWDPAHPFGGGPDGMDLDAGGASFNACFTDDNGNHLVVTVTLSESHSGYQYLHLGSLVNAPVEGDGSLLLAGGHNLSMTGTDPATAENTPEAAYSTFAGSAGGGDIVIIAESNQPWEDDIGQAQLFYSRLGADVNSVDVFNFSVNGTGNASLVVDAQTVANDVYGEGPGREFLDKLADASAVYFMGGNQWSYVDLLQRNTTAAYLISAGYNYGCLSVGGTSAGLQILGQYAFSAEFGGTTTETLLGSGGNIYAPTFYSDSHFAITDGVLGLDTLDGIITESHFQTLPTTPLGTAGSAHSVFRLGRLFATMSASMNQYDVDSINGLGIDEGAAMIVDSCGWATVYGADDPSSGQYVYFASASADGLSISGSPEDGGTLTLPSVNVVRYTNGTSFNFYDALAYAASDPACAQARPGGRSSA